MRGNFLRGRLGNSSPWCKWQGCQKTHFADLSTLVCTLASQTVPAWSLWSQVLRICYKHALPNTTTTELSDGPWGCLSIVNCDFSHWFMQIDSCRDYKWYPGVYSHSFPLYLACFTTQGFADAILDNILGYVFSFISLYTERNIKNFQSSSCRRPDQTDSLPGLYLGYSFVLQASTAR